jgi:hypothetical protein
MAKYFFALVSQSVVSACRLFRSICHEIAAKTEKLGPRDLMRTYRAGTLYDVHVMELSLTKPSVGLRGKFKNKSKAKVLKDRY